VLIRKGAMLLQVNDHTPITDVIPTAKALRYKGKLLVAVKHGLDEACVLRNLGLDAPSPLLYDGYQFSGRYTPMNHQVKTAEFLTLNRRAFVLSEMGTGKSSAALWAVDYLRQRKHVKRVLVVCPVSVTKVWADEGFTTTPHLSVGIMMGTRAKRLDVLAAGHPICVINFDGLTSLSKELKDKFDLIIVDEASAYRNAQTKRWKALRSLLTPEIRLWMMGGTPVPNAPTDAWAQCRLVNPSSVPPSFKLFQETVMRQVGPYKWVPKDGSRGIVWSVMQPAIRFEKKDCIDLPPITYNNRYCELSSDQLKAFETMRKTMRHEDENVSITAANAAVRVVKLQQICCGIVKDDMGDPVILDDAPRIDALLELLEEIEGKVIVFVPFIYVMQRLKQVLSEHYSCVVVNGSVHNTERSRIFSEFQNDPTGPKVLIAHPQTTAHGLTLTAASNIIWYAPIFSIEQYEQANARIDRTGQTNACTVTHIGAHPFEWAIYKALQAKASLQSALLQLYQQVLDGNLRDV
jgi:SNF2 family DNA or RNA helicase